MNTNDPKNLLLSLTAKQRKALPLLATGMSGVEVAREVKANPATVSQWQNHDADFATVLDLFRWEALRAAQDRLCALANGAVAE